jgi:hypothetical protein
MLVEFHPDATRELEASADWYAERSVSKYGLLPVKQFG